MTSPVCGQAPTETSVILQVAHDDIPRLPADTLVLYRKIKPAGTFGNEKLITIVAVSKQEKSHSQYLVLGFAQSVTVMTIHDGTTDYFTSLPPKIKKSFKTIQDLKAFMSIDSTGGKLYAIVLEQFTPKGPLTYELAGVKQRSGFGKASIHHVQASAGTLAEKKAFFGAGAMTKPEVIPTEPANATAEAGADSSGASPSAADVAATVAPDKSDKLNHPDEPDGHGGNDMASAAPEGSGGVVAPGELISGGHSHMTDDAGEQDEQAIEAIGAMDQNQSGESTKKSNTDSPNDPGPASFDIEIHESNQADQKASDQDVADADSAQNTRCDHSSTSLESLPTDQDRQDKILG